jgi:hypothetical protein
MLSVEFGEGMTCRSGAMLTEPDLNYVKVSGTCLMGLGKQHHSMAKVFSKFTAAL